MRQDSAQLLGLRALAWLAADDDLFAAFLAQSGGDAAQLRAQAQDPALHCAVLDFILMRDDWVIGCAEAVGARPEEMLMAREILGGGDRVHWT
ncbi:MAG: DUF3572 domain-containing protein [Paenirhodobacter sp.]|uniref:DUF3572 domain-containing protein n=1 Tax=Paenirhodobacter sp. TaxID=1965326 RepID=UPI003D13C4B0